jgi:2-methylisocitrate lyase-like PEP mutase family enzyme
VICDADTGFGGLLNLERTVRGYEAAGAAAIQLEDQVFPKRCGHTPGRRVIPLDDMVRKIKMTAATRASADFLIVARTDARTSLGLDEALRRGEAYARAGADILFIESPESEEEMARIGRHLDVPLVANMVEGGRTPVLSKNELEEIGYKIAIFPALGFLAMGAALEASYSHLLKTGSSTGNPAPLYDFRKFSELMGFDWVSEFDRKYRDAG